MWDEISPYSSHTSKKRNLFLGLANGKGKPMLLRCQAPNCMNEARGRAKFLDPRRGHGEELAYVSKNFCCENCQLGIMEELERQANYARVVN